jgi:hypothetical protein
MLTNSLSRLKKDLSALPPDEIVACCIRLAKFRKESKELLQYLLHDSSDEEAYVNGVKEEMNALAAEINHSNIYYSKKSFRKILRLASRYAKFSEDPRTPVELLLHFCSLVQKSGIDIQSSKVLLNMYQSQVEKIRKMTAAMHEDLQYDYSKVLENL